MSKKGYYIVFAVLIIVALLLRVYHLDTIPLSMHIDESGLGLNAWAIANYGTDRYGNILPICPINFYGEQSAFYTYFCAILVKLFGLNIYTLRMPGVIMGMVAIIFGALICKEKWGNRGLLTGAILMGIFPYFIMNSRFALDCNAMLGMITVALYSLIRLMKKVEEHPEKSYYGRFLLTGVLFGLVLYTYIIAAIVIAVFGILFGLYYLWYRKENRGKRFLQLVCMAVPLCIMIVPLLLVVCVNYFGLEPIVTPFFSIPRMAVNRTEEVAFSLSTLPAKIKGILCTLTTDGKYGSSDTYFTMYHVSVPFVLIGGVLGIVQTIKGAKDRKWTVDTAMLCLVVAECIMFVLCGLYNYHINGIFIALAYFCVKGLLEVYDFIGQQALKRLYFVLLMCIYAASFAGFSAEYFGKKETMAYQVYGGIEEALSLLTPEQREREIYITADCGEFYFLTNPVSPKEFAAGCDELGYVKDYKNLHFYRPEVYEEDYVYICTKASGLYSIFSDSSVTGHDYSVKETEHYYVFY